MAVNLRNYLKNEAGDGVASATVEAYRSDTMALVSTDTTAADGLWAFDGTAGHQAALGDLPAGAYYKIKIISGSQVRWQLGDVKIQVLEFTSPTTLTGITLNTPTINTPSVAGEIVTDYLDINQQAADPAAPGGTVQRVFQGADGGLYHLGSTGSKAPLGGTFSRAYAGTY